jgi:hypothetical protein
VVPGRAGRTRRGVPASSARFRGPRSRWSRNLLCRPSRHPKSARPSVPIWHVLSNRGWHRRIRCLFPLASKAGILEATKVMANRVVAVGRTGRGAGERLRGFSKQAMRRSIFASLLCFQILCFSCSSSSDDIAVDRADAASGDGSDDAPASQTDAALGEDASDDSGNGLTNDANQACGACPTPRHGSSACELGRCVALCPQGTALCEGRCTLRTDPCSEYGTCPGPKPACAGFCLNAAESCCALNRCGSYACRGDACLTACSTDGDCRAGSHCDLGTHQCGPCGGVGQPCCWDPSISRYDCTAHDVICSLASLTCLTIASLPGN